eukprot:gene15427-20811_t
MDSKYSVVCLDDYLDSKMDNLSVVYLVGTLVELMSLLFHQIPAGLSILGSCAVMATFIVFSDLRKLRYVQLVFFASLNDLIAAIGIAQGSTRDNSPSCWFQGIATNFNFLSSIFWTTIISYQMWLVVRYGRIITDKDMILIHLLCWGLPLLVALLPLTTNTYGNPYGDSEWCFISNNSDSPPYGQLLWAILSFYGWLWLAIIISIFLLIKVAIQLRMMAIIPKIISNSMSKLVFYPIISTICWTCATVTGIYFISTGDQHQGQAINVLSNEFAIILAVLQGFIFSITFFIMNPPIRLRWKILFIRCFRSIINVCCYFNCFSTNNVTYSQYGNIDNSLLSTDQEALLAINANKREFGIDHPLVDNEEDYILSRRTNSNNDVSGLAGLDQLLANAIVNDTSSTVDSNMSRGTLGAISYWHSNNNSNNSKRWYEDNDSSSQLIRASSITSTSQPNDSNGHIQA